MLPLNIYHIEYSLLAMLIPLFGVTQLSCRNLTIESDIQNHKTKQCKTYNTIQYTYSCIESVIILIPVGNNINNRNISIKILI